VFKVQVDQYNALRADYNKLQKDIEAAKTQYDTQAKQIAELTATNTALQVKSTQLQEQLKSTTAELINTKTSLQNKVNELSTAQGNTLKFQQENIRLTQSVINMQADYDVLNNRIGKVNKKTDPTIALFSTADNEIFYKVWSAWWATWH